MLKIGVRALRLQHLHAVLFLVTIMCCTTAVKSEQLTPHVKKKWCVFCHQNWGTRSSNMSGGVQKKNHVRTHVQITTAGFPHVNIYKKNTLLLCFCVCDRERGQKQKKTRSTVHIANNTNT